ncbi:hypothetical protein Nepgr_020739 [Nepenthes gracilis]|uniref:Uncharacterized protein n=1 Tax=Nepenthes gracilis TaxID=150966 RepID=A0AAD3XVH6_NEPGR|nr:hypothetical protein Nepgr_020739 [Nepenthes gracilis]
MSLPIPSVRKGMTLKTEEAIVLSESITGVAASISFSSLLHLDYDRNPLQDAIWHFPSLVLLKWCDDVQTVPCHAIRGMRSNTDPVHNVLNLFVETDTHYYSGKQGYQTLLRFLLLNLYKGIAEFMQGVASQKNLQLDYIDLYTIQWPVRMKKDSMTFELENILPVDIPSTWKTMKAVYDSEKEKVVDVSKLYMKKLGELLAIARAPPAINQAECHPAINQAECHPSWQQNKLHEFQSLVFVRAKERSVNVAYLEDMYERKREHKKVQVRWFLMLTVKTFNVDANVVQETGRTRNVGEQQCFLKIHSGAEHGKKTAYEPLCQDITYYMSSRSLFLPLNVEKSVFMEVCSQSTHPIHSHTADCCISPPFPISQIKSTFIKPLNLSSWCLLKSSVDRGAVFYLGDLRWGSEHLAYDADSKRGRYYCPVEHMMVGLRRLAVGNGENGRLWLLGIANFNSYIKCKTRNPSLETLLDLHPLTTPVGSLVLSLNLGSLQAKNNTIRIEIFAVPPLENN